MLKRFLIPSSAAALLAVFATGCIVVNVSRSDDKKPDNKPDQEKVEVETDPVPVPNGH